MSYHHDKSPFWRYFRDKLAWGLIGTPGALAVLVHGLARYLDTVRDDIYWLRDQFLPTTAEDQHIPLHGDSRGVPRTRFDTGQRYRTRVERAYRWHKLGAKEVGLPEILADYGFPGGVIHNVRHDNPDRWATFDINLLRAPPDFMADDIDAVLALANQYKPGRSILGRVQFAREEFAPVYVAAVAHTRITIDHHAQAWASLPPQPARLGLGAVAIMTITIDHKGIAHG